MTQDDQLLGVSLKPKSLESEEVRFEQPVYLARPFLKWSVDGVAILHPEKINSPRMPFWVIAKG